MGEAMKGDRQVGGLWCHEVLAVLSDYVDGEIEDRSRVQIEAHLRECDVCERFGGEFAYVIKETRKALQTPPPLDQNLAERLKVKILEIA